ncbi:DUF4184 family protein [Nocardiopsis halotolerans]|uniref:DUF4184 family protein n=1 Tax=Nocardiopsis halotolerans TaxID=124252 RepID=UPI00036A7C81|nr:DUF4184 family protein [Nocardiopsis halotolerans]
MLTVYVYVLRSPLYALAGRTAPSARPHRSARVAVRAAALTAAALAVGAVTHMAWDSLTQTGGALVRAWPFLSTPVVGPHLLHNVLMYASSAIGLTAVAWWAHHRARNRNARPPESAVGGRVRALALAAVAACAVMGAVVGGLSERAAVSGYDLVRCLLVGALTGTGLGLAAWTVTWWSRPAYRPHRRRSGPGRTPRTPPRR